MEIIDFTIEHNPNGFILVGQGLIPTLEIDDAQPAKPQRHANGLSVGVAVIPLDPRL